MKVTSGLDIYRTANLLIKQHGAEAPVHAAMRADAMIEKGDRDGRAEMTDWAEEANRTYAELGGWAEVRTKELSEMLQPYVEATDRYGELI